MEILEIADELELESVAQKVLAMLEASGHEDKAAVLALTGELGAGKTAFVKALARTLNIQEDVTSPTFVILKRYAVPEANDVQQSMTFTQLAHIDAYRIENVDEMRVLRFEELLASKDTIICIEWAENIKELLPVHTVHMHIEITKDKRTITIS